MYMLFNVYLSVTGADDDILTLEYYTEMYLMAGEDNDIVDWVEFLHDHGEDKFNWDVKYVDNITFFGDWKIIFKTVSIVLKREGINSETSATMEEFMQKLNKLILNMKNV